jgi:hypothetical protein
LGPLEQPLKREDRLLVGLNFFPPENPEKFLRKLANAYSDQTESFGLQFLAACGIEPDCRQVFASFGEDDDNPTVQVIRVFYSFPSETILSVVESR